MTAHAWRLGRERRSGCAHKIQPAANMVENVEANEPFTMHRAEDVTARHCPRGGSRTLATFVGFVGVAVLMAGCGGGSSLGVASISGSSGSGHHSASSRPRGGGVGFVGVAPSPAQRAANEVAGLLFSRCMRAHGVPDFPDPGTAAGGGFRFGVGGGGFDFAAPLFREAQRRCFTLLVRRRAGGG